MTESKPAGKEAKKNICSYCTGEHCYDCNQGDEIEYAAKGFQGKELYTAQDLRDVVNDALTRIAVPCDADFIVNEFIELKKGTK